MTKEWSKQVNLSCVLWFASDADYTFQSELLIEGYLSPIDLEELGLEVVLDEYRDYYGICEDDCNINGEPLFADCTEIPEYVEEWLDVYEDAPEEVVEWVESHRLRYDPKFEPFVVDGDGFEPFEVIEGESLDSISNKLNFLSEVEYHDQMDILRCYKEVFGILPDVDTNNYEGFIDLFQGKFSSPEDYINSIYPEGIPGGLSASKMFSEMIMGSEIAAINYDSWVYVFWNR